MAVRFEGSAVAMELTGVYSKPVWNALEKHFPLILANPYQVKSIPSEKTDPRDAESAGAWVNTAELRASARDS